jgi:hypothetical protein
MSAIGYGTAEARADVAWAVRPPRAHLRRVFLTCGVVLGAEIPLMLALDGSWQHALLPGYLILMVAFGAVFVLAAVTVAGFTAGVAAAGLVALDVVEVPVVLAGAAILAVACGLSPGWARVDTWQAARSMALTAGEEAAVSRAPLPAAGPHRPVGPGRRFSWRGDRVVAAFLVLAFPPAFAEFSLWFVGWVAQR